MKRFVSIDSVAEVNPKVPEYVSTALNNPATFLPMAAVSESGRIASPEEALIGEVIKGYRYFEEGDTLLAKITPCMENGKAVLVEGVPHRIGFGSTEFHVIRPGSDIYERYLFYMVWNPSFRYIAARNMTGTAGQRRVPTNFIKRFEIPLPPFDEQRRIAAILDKADAVRRKRKEAIALTEDLLRSAFLEMFGDPVTNPKGWEIRPLRSVVKQISSGWSANGEEREIEYDEWGVLKISAVTSGQFLPQKHKAVGKPPFPKTLVVPQKGDLLFSRANTRELVAAVCLVERDCERLFLPDKLWKIQTDTSLVNVEYLKFLVSESKYRDLITRKATGTSGSMLNISQKKLLEMLAPIPPIRLQNDFATYVWKTFATREQLTKASTQSENLFNSLLQCAFRGHL